MSDGRYWMKCVIEGLEGEIERCENFKSHDHRDTVKMKGKIDAYEHSIAELEFAIEKVTEELQNDE